jgi:SAM-dependent methyltransferase
MAANREHWIQLNRHYYEDLERFYRSVIPRGSRVLEIGSGTGDLLAAVEPSYGVGIDFSPAFVEMARQRHPGLTFLEMDAVSLDIPEKFDYVILAGTLGYLADIQEVLTKLRQVCTEQTRIILTYHNFLWEPVLRLGERVGLRMPLPAQSWLSGDDIANLLDLTGYRVIKRGNRMLLPRHVPVVSSLINRYVAQLPVLNHLCLTGYLVARVDESALEQLDEAATKYSCSVIIPARNERGNIETAIRRMPRLGRHTEVIFIEGHSSDGTYEEIERVAKLYGGEWDIKVLQQTGKGKGDAVRAAFAAASGDVLMILDADLTVLPEDLPKFFNVIVSGRGEFANGCRLVYPRSHRAMPFRNTLANKTFGMLFSYLLGQPFTDTLCGTKALWRRDYEKIVAGRSFFGNFDPFGDFDLLFGAAKLNLHIVDVPVRYDERSYGQSNIQHTKEGLILLRMCAYASRKIKFI